MIYKQPCQIISNPLTPRCASLSVAKCCPLIAANKALMGLKGDSRAGSRRGSLIPGQRSRQGSIQLGGTERRGSYYEDGVTQRATVAMVTDDPEHKKNVKAGLAGAFDDSAISEYNLSANFLTMALMLQCLCRFREWNCRHC